jgi:hypothetical protein
MSAKRLFLVLTTVLFCISFAHAKKIEGYIVTQDFDTINGKIILPKFNRYSGGYSIASFNQVSLHYEVWFKGNQDKRFKRYEATDIAGFGFVFSSYPYFFRSFTIESNTPFKRVKQKHRFLKLSYYGKVCLYYDIVQMKVQGIHTAHPSQSYDDIVTFKEYYLYNDSIGLKKV